MGEIFTEASEIDSSRLLELPGSLLNQTRQHPSVSAERLSGVWRLLPLPELTEPNSIFSVLPSREEQLSPLCEEKVEAATAVCVFL